MSSALKEKIQHYLRTENRSIGELEKRSSVPNYAIYNILSERSKNPKLETIVKIANAIECSLDEIFGRDEYIAKVISNRLINVPNNYVLFNSVITYVDQYIQKHFLTNFKFNDTIFCIEEIYKYSIKTGKLDKNFADWFLEKTFQNK